VAKNPPSIEKFDNLKHQFAAAYGLQSVSGAGLTDSYGVDSLESHAWKAFKQWALLHVRPEKGGFVKLEEPAPQPRPHAAALFRWLRHEIDGEMAIPSVRALLDERARLYQESRIYNAFRDDDGGPRHDSEAWEDARDILSDGGAVEISDEELNSRVAAILNGFMERFTRNVEERNRSRLFRLEWALSAVSSRGSMIDTDADVIERAFGPVFAAIEAAERDISAYEAAQAQAGRKVPWHNPPRPGLMLIRGILENVAPGGVAPSVSNRRAIVMIADRTGDVPPLEYRLSHLDFLIAMLFTAGAPSQMARDYLVELGYPPMTEKALNTRWHRLQDDGVVARQKRKPGRKKKNGNGCGGG
jgi:hypothetical protein